MLLENRLGILQERPLRLFCCKRLPIFAVPVKSALSGLIYIPAERVRVREKVRESHKNEMTKELEDDKKL